MATSPSEIARRWYQETWNERRTDTVEELVASDWVGRSETGDLIDKDDLRGFCAQILGAFPDIRMEVDDVIEQGDRVAIRWHFTGTHSGPHLGPNPTGRPVNVPGMSWMELRDGRIVRSWDSWNLGGLLKSLDG